MPQSEFLKKLQQQAALQAQIHQQRVLPKELDYFTSALGNYPWQILLLLSLVSALIWEGILG